MSEGTTHISANKPNARSRSAASVYTVLKTPIPRPASSPAASPRTARPAMSTAIVGAVTVSATPPRNTAVAIHSCACGPIRAYRSAPTGIIAIPTTPAIATATPYCASPPNSIDATGNTAA